MDYWAATLCPSLYKHLPLHTITCSTVTIENCAIDYVLIQFYRSYFLTVKCKILLLCSFQVYFAP